MSPSTYEMTYGLSTFLKSLKNLICIERLKGPLIMNNNSKLQRSLNDAKLLVERLMLYLTVLIYETPPSQTSMFRHEVRPSHEQSNLTYVLKERF